MDINQGCAGYVIGLIQAFLLLEQKSVRRVALVTADVLSRRVSPRDRNSYPLIGDAAAITIVERRPDSGEIHAVLKMDGSRADVLIIPAGGFRLPSSAATAQLKDGGDKNFRADDHLRMEGSEVFNFVMNEVPQQIEEVLQLADLRTDDVEYFLCHQPNRFILQKLADRLGVPHHKMPGNVVGCYGNSNSVTIPAAIALNLANRVTRRSYQVCFSGFGVGLTWNAMTMKLGSLNFAQTIEFPSAARKLD